MIHSIMCQYVLYTFLLLAATSAILRRDRGWRRKGRARGVAQLGHARSRNNAVRWNWSLGHTADGRRPAPDVGCAAVGSVGERETGREGEGRSHVVDKNIAATAGAADAALVASAPRQGHEGCVFSGFMERPGLRAS